MVWGYVPEREETMVVPGTWLQFAFHIEHISSLFLEVKPNYPQVKIIPRTNQIHAAVLPLLTTHFVTHDIDHIAITGTLIQFLALIQLASQLVDLLVLFFFLPSLGSILKLLQHAQSDQVKHAIGVANDDVVRGDVD